MATIDFGLDTKTSDDYIAEIYETIGAHFPLSVAVGDGKLLRVSAETEWREGGTTPVEEEVEIEKTLVVDGVEETVKVTETRVVDYEEDYTEKKLTKAQVDDLNAYIEDNLVQ